MKTLRQYILQSKEEISLDDNFQTKLKADLNNKIQTRKSPSSAQKIQTLVFNLFHMKRAFLALLFAILLSITSAVIGGDLNSNILNKSNSGPITIAQAKERILENVNADKPSKGILHTMISHNSFIDDEEGSTYEKWHDLDSDRFLYTTRYFITRKGEDFNRSYLYDGEVYYEYDAALNQLVKTDFQFENSDQRKNLFSSEEQMQKIFPVGISLEDFLQYDQTGAQLKQLTDKTENLIKIEEQQIAGIDTVIIKTKIDNTQYSTQDFSTFEEEIVKYYFDKSTFQLMKVEYFDTDGFGEKLVGESEYKFEFVDTEDKYFKNSFALNKETNIVEKTVDGINLDTLNQKGFEYGNTLIKNDGAKLLYSEDEIIINNKKELKLAIHNKDLQNGDTTIKIYDDHYCYNEADGQRSFDEGKCKVSFELTSTAQDYLAIFNLPAQINQGYYIISIINNGKPINKLMDDTIYLLSTPEDEVYRLNESEKVLRTRVFETENIKFNIPDRWKSDSTFLSCQFKLKLCNSLSTYKDDYIFQINDNEKTRFAYQKYMQSLVQKCGLLTEESTFNVKGKEFKRTDFYIKVNAEMPCEDISDYDLMQQGHTGEIVWMDSIVKSVSYPFLEVNYSTKYKVNTPNYSVKDSERLKNGLIELDKMVETIEFKN